MEGNIMVDYRHIWLYSKGHYKCTNTMQDLKIIIGEACWLEPEHVEDEDVFMILLSIIHEHLEESQHTPMILKVMGFGFRYKEVHSHERSAKAILGEIARIKIREGSAVFHEIGEVDSSILEIGESY